MNKHWQKFQSIYPHLDTESREFVDSEQIPNLAKTLVRQNTLDTKFSAPIIVATTNYYLRIISEKELLNELVESGITKEKATNVTENLKQQIDPVDKSLIEEVEKSNSPEGESMRVTNTPPEEKGNLQQEIAKTTESLQQIQSMRTMQTDYQKQSPAAAPQNQPKTAVPQAETSTTNATDTKPQPQWDSDAK